MKKGIITLFFVMACVVLGYGQQKNTKRGEEKVKNHLWAMPGLLFL